MQIRKFLPGLLLSGALIVFVAYRMDIAELLSAMRAVRPSMLLLAVSCMSCTLVVRSIRWRYLLEPVKSIGMDSLLPVTAIGAMTDMLLPARAGDLVRAYLVGEKEQISKISSLATIVLEKALDIMTLAFVALALLLFLALSGSLTLLPSGTGHGALVFTLVLGLLLGGLWIVASRPKWLETAVERLFGFLPDRWAHRIDDGIAAFSDGLETLKQGRHLPGIVLLSALLWAVFAASNYFILRAFDLDLPIYAGIMILIFQILGVTLPSSPGFVGTYHAAVLVGLAFFGVRQELALSVAITMHAAFFFPFVLLGLLFLWRGEYAFNMLWARKSETPEGSVLENRIHG